MVSQPPMFITPLAGFLMSSILQLCKYIASLLQFCRPVHYFSLSEFEGKDYYQGIEKGLSHVLPKPMSKLSKCLAFVGLQLETSIFELLHSKREGVTMFGSGFLDRLLS